MKIEDFLNQTDKDFRKSLLIDLESIEDQLRKITIQFFDFNYIYVKTLMEYNNAKASLRKTEKHLYRSIKLQFDQAKVKATEKMIESKIEGNSLYTRSYENYLKAREAMEFTKIKKESIDLKIKMLELLYDSLKTKSITRSKLQKQEA